MFDKAAIQALQEGEAITSAFNSVQRALCTMDGDPNTGILPSTLVIVGGGVTLLDSGGVLQMGGEPVGAVDHANGIVTLSSDVFGTGAATQPQQACKPKQQREHPNHPNHPTTHWNHHV